ncbi:MAG: hypothetical protein PHY30_02110 [Candidatus Pacebacteria bacterium]|nr:hypothetical protein [Candidatus Paceibacterota bacterium]
MKQKKIINLIVWLLVAFGIIIFVNSKTENSLASMEAIFNPCDINHIQNCSDAEKIDLIKKNLK